MPTELTGAPPDINAALHRLTQDLTQAAGTNLAALIVYGGLARGRFRPGRSDVNVMVLLNDASAAAIAAIAPALQQAWRAAGVEPLILTPEELPRAARDFPIKFLDIKEHHVILAGSDPFPALDIPRERIRLRVEQELRNLLLRLRHQFISSADDAAAQRRVLANAARPLAIELAALLMISQQDAGRVDRTADIYDSAAKAFGLDAGSLRRLAEFRQEGKGSEAEISAMYAGVLDAVAKAAAVAESMQEGER